MTETYSGGAATAYAEAQEEDTLRNKYLVFVLDGLEYAVAVAHVVDIINILPVTRVPNCPDYVTGITNLRGKIIPIIDMRLRFGKEQSTYTERTCIIVVEYELFVVGLIIDEVSEVIVFEDSQIAAPPVYNDNAGSRFISGVGHNGDGVTLILDCERILSDATDSPVEELH
ncbi:chemotaxis protein CheW [Oscillospiraceae bacterium MB08-C2-2]|nr:chemotaxis protein CheW [Oscillospiraceae bacterium MB08-C2-2]